MIDSEHQSENKLSLPSKYSATNYVLLVKYELQSTT